MTAKDFLDLKEYLKLALKIEKRKDINGNDFLVLVLDDELISIVPFNLDEI